MEDLSMRQLRAFVLHDLRDMLVNPTVAAWILMPAVLMALLAALVGMDDADIALFCMSVALSGTIAMVSSTPTVFTMAENREHGAFGVLMRSGVGPAAIALGRLAATLLACAACTALAYLLMCVVAPAYSAASMPAAVAALVPMAIFSCVISAAGGLLVRDQRTVYLYTVPALVVFLASLIQGLPFIEGPLWLLPGGLSTELLGAALNGTSVHPDPAALLITYAMWMIIAASCYAFALQRFSRELHDEPPQRPQASGRRRTPHH